MMFVPDWLVAVGVIMVMLALARWLAWRLVHEDEVIVSRWRKGDHVEVVAWYDDDTVLRAMPPGSRGFPGIISDVRLGPHKPMYVVAVRTPSFAEGGIALLALPEDAPDPGRIQKKILRKILLCPEHGLRSPREEEDTQVTLVEDAP